MVRIVNSRKLNKGSASPGRKVSSVVQLRLFKALKICLTHRFKDRISNKRQEQRSSHYSEDLELEDSSVYTKDS